MTSRELAFEALQHRAPPRIPWTLYAAKPLAAKLETLWGARDRWPCPADDLVRILWDVETEEVSATLFRDRFGCEWRREQGGYVFVNPPLTETDASLIPRVELITDAHNTASRRVAERCGFTLEGVLRHERRGADGTLRDTCIYARLAGADADAAR